MSVDPTMPLAPRAYPPPERWRARLAVLAAKILARRSPSTIVKVLNRVSAGSRPATYAEASRAREVVTRTSRACASPKGCLPRSIATALLCRSRGSWPVWCAGVRVLPPFGAHAWVLAEGLPVDEPAPPGYHRVLLRVPREATP
ncbi:lasso peptide biosynthesis B2 protein [Nonomuraea sp. NPDC050790]|uniref:lasso peptide biosynthesis B2 protein n=1 Tax=Nonomuraea sp. NPDC050790 TaxID=3364371 RepID=UPI0037995C9B